MNEEAFTPKWAVGSPADKFDDAAGDEDGGVILGLFWIPCHRQWMARWSDRPAETRCISRTRLLGSLSADDRRQFFAPNGLGTRCMRTRIGRSVGSGGN
jgi:hypothetical protein